MKAKARVEAGEIGGEGDIHAVSASRLNEVHECGGTARGSVSVQGRSAWPQSCLSCRRSHHARRTIDP
jgi:hypothetical protein